MFVMAGSKHRRDSGPEEEKCHSTKVAIADIWCVRLFSDPPERRVVTLLTRIIQCSEHVLLWKSFDHRSFPFVIDRHAKSNLEPRARNPGERIFSAIKQEISRASDDDLVESRFRR
jgi:hypothetical protein